MDLHPIDPIRLVIRTAAPSDLAWNYLTDPERVAEWFTDASELGEVGTTYRLDFGDGSVVEGPLVEVVPGRRFAHRWAWVDATPVDARPADATPVGATPRQETLVRWEVRPLDAGGSEIELIHEGWTEAGADDAIRDDHEAYWSGYLDDLRDLLEDAAGS